MKKLTIGMFNDSFYPMIDGVVMVMDNYAKRLSKDNNVIVVVPRYKKKYEDSNFPYKVIRCRSIKIPFLDYSLPLPLFDRKFRKEVKKYNFDIIHIHSPFSLGKFGLKIAKKENIPVVTTMHSQFKQDFKKAVHFDWLATILTKKIIKIFNSSTECFAVNEAIKDVYINDYGCNNNVVVYNNATEMLPVKDSKQAINYINKLYNIKDEYVFLFVGRINTLKNILLIVDSLKIIKNKRPDIKFKMLFVGFGQDEEILRKKINELNLNKDVILCGKVTDREILSYYYERADLFLFPSIYDTSSLVQVEAACGHTPSVLIKDTVTASTVTDNVNGYLTNNNKKDYANKIIEIIDNPKEYKKVCENAYNELYVTWDIVVKKIYNRYIELINKM